MKSKVMALLLFTLCLNACTKNPPPPPTQPGYCERIKAEIYSAPQRTHYNAQNLPITRARLMKEYQAYGCRNN